MWNPPWLLFEPCEIPGPSCRREAVFWDAAALVILLSWSMLSEWTGPTQSVDEWKLEDHRMSSHSPDRGRRPSCSSTPRDLTACWPVSHTSERCSPELFSCCNRRSVWRPKFNEAHVVFGRLGQTVWVEMSVWILERLLFHLTARPVVGHSINRCFGWASAERPNRTTRVRRVAPVGPRKPRLNAAEGSNNQNQRLYESRRVVTSSFWLLEARLLLANLHCVCVWFFFYTCHA